MYANVQSRRISVVKPSRAACSLLRLPFKKAVPNRIKMEAKDVAVGTEKPNPDGRSPAKSICIRCSAISAESAPVDSNVSPQLTPEMYLFVQHQINLSCLDSAASGAQHRPKLGRCVGACPFRDLHTGFEAPAKVNSDLSS